jgi:hypothetical protein
LEVIRRLCYKFIWLGDQKKKGLVLASWKKLALPKANGGWGLKNPFLFSKALATKNVWRLIQGKGYVVQVIRAKYIAPTSVEDWVRNPIKQVHNASIIWKVVNSTFHLVGNWLIWQVGKGDKVQIGLDPWVGNKGMHILLPG